MADIFISYSKADRELALKLSAFLEAEGWTTWWDKSLNAADAYRDVIMKELMAARAVISIWTPTSIKSDWVRAEAGRAKAEGKLIPVKSSDVHYADIPLPFGEMHTENVTATALIRAAVVAQLTKPKVEPSGLWIATRKLRFQVLTWAGILGGSLTLFSNFRSLISLADWARWVVVHWQEWTHYLWNIAFGWLGIHVPPSITPILSLTLFIALLLIGTNLRTSHRVGVKDVGYFLTLSGVYIASILAAGFLMSFVMQAEYVWIALAASVSLIYVAPFSVVIFLSRERLQCLLMLVLLVLFWFMMVLVQLAPFFGGRSSPTDTVGLVVGFVLVIFGAFAIVSFAPLKAVNERLVFVAIGALLLIALNKLSVLGVQHFLEPPRVD